jgi:hypothetical protein
MVAITTSIDGGILEFLFLSVNKMNPWRLEEAGGLFIDCYAAALL